MLVHVLRDVGHVEIGVVLVGKLLQLGVERLLFFVSIQIQRMEHGVTSGQGKTHSSEAHFISQVVEPTDAVLGVLKVVVFDEAESEGEVSKLAKDVSTLTTPTGNLPLA